MTLSIIFAFFIYIDKYKYLYVFITKSSCKYTGELQPYVSYLSYTNCTYGELKCYNSTVS